MLGQWSDRLRRRISHRATIALVITLSVLVGATSYAFAGYLHPSAAGPSACKRQPISGTSVLSGSSAELAAEVASSLLGCASSVVVANDNPASVAAAVPLAEQAHAPLLLSSPLSATATSIISFRGGLPARNQASASSASTLAVLREINDLHPRNVLVVGLKTSELSAEMPGARVTSNPAGLAAMSPPKPLSHLVVLVSKNNPAVAMAATATAEAAGAKVVAMPGYDPRGDAAAITTIAQAKPRDVIAVGGGFGPTSQLVSRLAVVRTGVQLPDGGQLVVPMHRLVALYGHPGTPSLGALGEQGINASVARIKKLAASYQALSKSPVVPTFEIITTLATSAAGPAGDYSYETPVATLRPWIAAATKAGMYVILDLQPGRDSFLQQAKAYQSLLELPNVGLALDPEWALKSNQLPLRQIGNVSISQVNSVVDWLGQLTAEYRLPQKLLVLHEFKAGEISDLPALDAHNDDLAVVMDMDGQGSPSMKQATWNFVTHTTPAGVPFGWKDFFVKDSPMLNPKQTMEHTPQPVMISYE